MTTNLTRQTSPRLDELPAEIVSQIVSPLSIKDLSSVEEAYKFNYSLLDLPGVLKPINVQAAFSNYDLFLKYRQRYQRTFLTSNEIRLALNGGDPQILDSLYRENFLPFETFLATLVIKGQDSYLEELDLKEFYPWFDLNPYIVYPSLIIAGIIYVTWGTYAQIESFFTKYPYTDFEADHWLGPYNYQDIPLFPYHCTDAEYSNLMRVDWLPEIYWILIENNLRYSTRWIYRSILFLGRDVQLARRVSQDTNPGFILIPFTQNVPILGQPLIKARFIKKYYSNPEIMAELPYSKFQNEEALWLVLNQYRYFFLDAGIYNVIVLMKHAIASDLPQLFSQLWDFIADTLQRDLLRSYMLNEPQMSRYGRKKYASILDASLSVDNPFFFEECQRRDPNLMETLLYLPLLVHDVLDLDDDLSEEEILIEYLFTYHRLVAFERIKSTLSLDLALSYSVAKILSSSFHYGTLIKFLKAKEETESPQSWKSIFSSLSQLKFDEGSQMNLKLTWPTDQPLLHFSDLVLTIKELIPPDLPLYRLFFNQESGIVNFIRSSILNMIYTDSADLLDLIYYFWSREMIDDFKIVRKEAFRLGLVRMILNLIREQLLFTFPVNVTYNCLEILRETSTSDYRSYRDFFKEYYFPDYLKMADEQALFKYADQPGLMAFLDYLNR